MLAAGGLVVVTGWLLAPWVVMALFERGAFGAQDSERVAQALRIGLFQLPFLFSGIVLVQWIVALGNYRFLLVAAIAAVASKVLLNELLTSRLGLDGVMYATAGMYAISWALQALFLWKTQTETGPR
jgi:putative peptidoglycan lipid II flippase